MKLLAAASKVVESTTPAELPPMNWLLAGALVSALAVLISVAFIVEARKK